MAIYSGHCLGEWKVETGVRSVSYCQSDMVGLVGGIWVVMELMVLLTLRGCARRAGRGPKVQLNRRLYTHTAYYVLLFDESVCSVTLHGSNILKLPGWADTLPGLKVTVARRSPSTPGSSISITVIWNVHQPNL